MKLTTKNFKIYRVSELITLTDMIITILKDYEERNPKLAAKIELLEQYQQALVQANAAVSFKELTKLINEDDFNRDEDFKTFRRNVRSLLTSRRPGVAAAAELINNAVVEQGDVINELPIEQESTAINALNKLFTTNARYAEALTRLGVGLFWDDVMQSQRTLESDIMKRYDTIRTESAEESAIEVAARVRQQLSAIGNLIEALYVVEESAEMETLISRINQVLEAAQQKVRTRTSLAAKDAVDEKK